ncbi:MAG: Shr3 amino acid permease chaperone [Lentinula lateritia]|nr:MAG: Shr3 amino acid permease chaperone [Lentinula lateritia]
MGVRAAVVVCVTSFLLRSLFTHWIADSLMLWKSLTNDQNLWTAATYYSIIANGPAQIQYAVATVALLGATTILWSLRDGRAGNLMFDGGNIFLFCTTTWMYSYSVIPTIFTVFKDLPPHPKTDTVPQELQLAFFDLASNNLVRSVALTGVLGLQAGRFWTECADDDDTESLKATPAPSRAKTPQTE